MDWTVTTAREHLAQVLDAAQQTPQLIFRHGQLAGAVVGPEAAAQVSSPTLATLADCFAELRGLLAGQDSPWDGIERRDRANPWAESADAVDEDRDAPAL